MLVVATLLRLVLVVEIERYCKSFSATFVQTQQGRMVCLAVEEV
jgi:hypothetical protein